MNRSFFFILGVVLGLLTLQTGCGKATRRIQPKQVTDGLPTISKVSYDQLLALSPEALARKAAAKQLGNCVGVYQPNTNCTSKYTFILKLSNVGQDFLLPERPEPTATICSDNAGLGFYMREALLTGVCYSVTDLKQEDVEALPVLTLARRAYYGTLKYCTMQKVNSNLCSTGGSTYGIYLTNTSQYYPYMTTSPHPLGCFTDIGTEVKNAITEGYCFPQK